MTTATRPFRAARNLRLLYAFGALTGLQPGIAIWVVYLLDFRHLTLAQVGLMEAFFWGVKVLLEVPAGAIADRFGRRTAFVLGLLVEGSGIVMFAFASSYPLLVLAYGLWAGGFAFRSGNDQAYLYDTLVAAGRSEEFSALAGRYQAMWSVAIMLTGIGGAALASSTTLQVPLALGAIPYAIALGAVAMMDEPPRANAEAPRLRYLQTLQAAASALRRAPAVRGVLLFEIALSSAFVADMLLLQPFMQQHGVGLALFGIMQVPVRLGAVVGSVGAAWVIRVTGIRRLAGGALLMTLAGLLVLALFDHVAAFIGFVVMQMALGVMGPASSGYVNDRTESNIRATVMSVVPLGTAIVFTIVGPFAGIVGDASLRLAFGAMALVLLLAAGAALLAWLAAERAESAEVTR